MTLRYGTALSVRQTYPKGQLAAGGRWERLLRHLQTQGPRPISALSRETDPGHHDRDVERRKIMLALKALADLGLVAPAREGWMITPAGAQALKDI